MCASRGYLTQLNVTYVRSPALIAKWTGRLAPKLGKGSVTASLMNLPIEYASAKRRRKSGTPTQNPEFL